MNTNQKQMKFKLGKSLSGLTPAYKLIKGFFVWIRIQRFI